MPQVLLDSVTKTYPGGVRAVDGVTIDASDGEFVVLVGPSGSGKSTTLRMIAGLETVTDGTISIGDRVVNRLHPRDRDIAMVFQDYALYPHMTVRKNLSFALRLRKTPKEEIARRVADVAAMLGIEALLDRKPRALSGGQQQRVALGRAIVREPAAFLFDEPLSNLDARLRVTTRAELKALHRRLQTTTIYVTHDQEEAMTLGDRVAVMCDGRLQQYAPPLEVYRHPANRFVAGFIGAPPMNFVEGAIERDADAVRFTADGDDGVFTLPRAAADTDGPAVLGVRPTHLAMTDDADVAAFAVTVDVIEHLGDVVDIVGRLPSGASFIARAAPTADLVVGATVRLAPDLTRARLFVPGPFGAALETRTALAAS